LKQVTATITESIEVMPGVYLVWLEAPYIASAAQPGQFFMVRCGEEFLLRRPLSVHQVTDNGKLALLFNVVGKGTQWLAECQVGDSIDLLGPMGNGYSIHADARSLLLVAGGIGIAPLRFLTDKAIEAEKKVTLLVGAATAAQLYPGKLPPEVKLVVATEDGTAGQKGMITDFLPDFIDRADQLFVCGPVDMYRVIASRKPQLLNGKSVQVSLEVRMGCGLGICYGCTVKTKQGLKQVCRDGPVFELDDILWDELNW